MNYTVLEKLELNLRIVTHFEVVIHYKGKNKKTGEGKQKYSNTVQLLSPH